MATITDPVCGMNIQPTKDTAQIVYQGTTYMFCSNSCRTAFESDPDRYAHSRQS